MWTYNYNYNYNNELYHYGIKGMKWGVRRFQNKDGSLTAEGRRRSDSFIERQQRRAEKKDRKAPERLDMPNNVSSTTKRVIKDYNSMNSREFSSKYQVSKSTYAKRVKKYGDPYMNSPLAKYGKKLQAKEKAKQAREEYYKTSEGKKELAAKRAKTIAAGAAVAGTALAVYGAYKVSKAVKNKAYSKALETGSKASTEYMKKFNRLNMYDLQTMEGLNRSNSLSDKLTKSDLRYAKESSKNLPTAVKTLLNKNPKLSDAQLLNMGIDLADYPEAKEIFKVKKRIEIN